MHGNPILNLTLFHLPKRYLCKFGKILPTGLFVCFVAQGFSLASAIGHSPKIVPDVREFAVQFGQFVRDNFQKPILYGNAQ